jgi:phytoene dehydrogenase-like protein
MDGTPNKSIPCLSTEHFDVIVLGSGISGLVTASILSKQGLRIAVVEEYEHVGGNHIDWSSPTGYTCDIGSLIFQDDSPLLRHFPEILPLYVPIRPTWGRLNPQGKVTKYPISIRDDVLGAGVFGMARMVGSLLFARVFQRRMENARDFARFWLGSCFLRRSGLETYMRRFYGIEPEHIDLDLAQKRMMWIAESASITKLLRRTLRRKRSNGTQNRQMARPRAGFATLYQPAIDRLESSGVTFILSASPSSIKKSEDAFQLSLDDRLISSKRVVSTVPISSAQKLCGLVSNSRLGTITLITLYFSFSGERGFAQSIIYNFSYDGSWKRLTVYSEFYGMVADREYFAVEVVAGDVGCAKAAETDFRQHCKANGLFKGDLKLEGSHMLTNAYPIYSKGASQDAAAAIAGLREFGVETFGRQGGFNYQPTARVSTLDVESALGVNRRRGE